MLSSTTTILSFLLASASVFAAPAHHLALRSPGSSKKAIIQLFGWNWQSVQNECAFIGSAGYGYVQVSPASEHLSGDQWWTDYQVVSYQIQSKRGNRAQFKSMVDACHKAGVQVIVDVIFNHMAGVDSGSGVAGSQFTHYNYPGIYDAQDFHYCGTQYNAITNWNDENQLENCQLSNLADLNTGSEKVRARLAQHGNDLLSLGVDGLRFDAAKHVSPGDSANILNRLSRKVYVTGEVEDTSGRFSQAHTNTGDVQEFRYAYALKNAFLNYNIADLTSINNRGLLASGNANVFIANHDTERGSATLSYKSSRNVYTLAHVYMLSYPYGTPTILSGFQFDNTDAGAPNGGYGSCTGTGPTNGWECAHRWTAVTGMVGFFNAVGTSGLTNVLTTGNKAQLAYGRGNVGHVAINSGDGSWNNSFQTSLPAGKYCDVVSGKKNGNSCTGATITVANGKFSVNINAQSAIAIYTGAKL